MRRGAVLILLAVLTGAGCTSTHAPGSAKSPAASDLTPAPVPAATAKNCPASIAPRPLPAWARAGFHPPARPVPYVMGARGTIVAILWASHDPLHSPPLANRANKILWVARVKPADPLRISAILIETGQTATRELSRGPGPLHLNLPAAGCWALTLNWDGQQDNLKLQYVAP